MAQDLVVALIVALALLYSLLALMPAAWRRALAGRLARGMGWSDARAGRVEQALSAGACSDCERCGGCKPAAPPPAEAVVSMQALRDRERSQDGPGRP
ncbi:MAG: DUF6587 family protein [Pseudomonadota bacterium]